jgi:hypothetical protein
MLDISLILSRQITRLVGIANPSSGIKVRIYRVLIKDHILLIEPPSRIARIALMKNPALIVVSISENVPSVILIQAKFNNQNQIITRIRFQRWYPIGRSQVRLHLIAALGLI